MVLPRPGSASRDLPGAHRTAPESPHHPRPRHGAGGLPGARAGQRRGEPPGGIDATGRFTRPAGDHRMNPTATGHRPRRRPALPDGGRWPGCGRPWSGAPPAGEGDRAEPGGRSPHPPTLCPRSAALAGALATAFELSPFERDVLLLCAGAELDASFPALCRARPGGPPERPHPSFGLALAALPGAHWSVLTPGRHPCGAGTFWRWGRASP